MQSQSKLLFAREGFLLIELLVTLLLLAVFTYIIACYQNVSIQTGYEAIKRWKAVNVASSFLAKVSVDPLLLQKKNYHDEEYEISWNCVPVEVSSSLVLTSKKKLSYLDLTVSWLGLDNKYHYYHCIGGYYS